MRVCLRLMSSSTAWNWLLFDAFLRCGLRRSGDTRFEQGFLIASSLKLYWLYNRQDFAVD